MKQTNYYEYLDVVLKKLRTTGLFLTSGIDKPNSMTIGWSSIGNYWAKPVFVVPVRISRYTHHLIEETKEFTVSIPFGDNMKEALAYCGSKSGRDCDKFKELGLTTLPGQTVKVPVVGECDLYYECRVIYKQDMKLERLDDVLREKFYPDCDIHTIYYGEILACYKI